MLGAFHTQTTPARITMSKRTEAKGLSRTAALDAVGPGWRGLIAHAWDIIRAEGGQLTDIQVGPDYLIFGATGIAEDSDAGEKLMDLAAFAAEICVSCARNGSPRTRKTAGGGTEQRTLCDACTDDWLTRAE